MAATLQFLTTGTVTSVGEEGKLRDPLLGGEEPELRGITLVH